MTAEPQNARPAGRCAYPACNCPFDAPGDPNWCARGLLPRLRVDPVTDRRKAAIGGGAEDAIEAIRAAFDACATAEAFTAAAGMWDNQLVRDGFNDLVRQAQYMMDVIAGTPAPRRDLHPVSNLNQAICTALGVHDLDTVTKVTLVSTPNDFATVHVERSLPYPAVAALQKIQLTPRGL